MALSNRMRTLLTTAREAKASDIHIVAGLPPTFRVSGEILPGEVPPLTPEETTRLAYDLMNEEQRKAFEENWQLCCTVFDEELGRFRVSVYYHKGTPELAIRPVLSDIASRDELRLPEVVEDLSRQPNGLVLITGPTGNGKTTTMTYMIDLINCERRCKIITIEDPVEFVHTRKMAVIVQQELYTDVKSFDAALVHVLRQNPDVICVGEMRDYETTATAMMAAETGHLVIATCHTPNAMKTIDRIVSVFPPEQQGLIVAQLANSLRGIIAQRLVPRVDKSDRVLACEILIGNAAARSCIRDNRIEQLPTIIQLNRKEDMQTMDDSLTDLYLKGLIGYDTCLTHVESPETFLAKIRPGGV